MDPIKKLKSGKSQIVKDLAFCYLLDSKLPLYDKTFTQLFKEFDAKVKTIDNSITTGALNNAHGDWYEWLLAISSWNYFIENNATHLALLLPNVSRFDVGKLYVEDLHEFLTDLRSKVATSSDVELISSNPDFVIIHKNLAQELMKDQKVINEVTPDELVKLQTFYNSLKHRCNFEDIVGYISVKTSFRPDRRLQIAHEGSLMKALYIHLQTRQWIINPKGLKYYALSTEVGAKDRDALKTVATHSITSVHSLPQAAVDEVFRVNSLKECGKAWEEILD